jgi:DNA-binding beta-propeller fold protein YncE
MRYHTALGVVAIFVARCLEAQTVTFLDSFGAAGSGDGQFANPGYIALHPATGQVYVSDQGNTRIQRVDAAGVYETQTSIPPGALGLGIRNSTGQVYITTSSIDTVQRYDTDLAFQLEWGSMGSGNGQFVVSFGIAVNQANGQVYVADRDNNRIQRFDPNGAYLGQWGSTGVGNGQFNQPAGIAINSTTGQVYVADRFNHRVQRFDAGGVYQTQWGSLGSEEGQFNLPIGIDVDGAGNVYVTEATGNRVQRFTAGGQFQLKFGSPGSGDGQFNTALGVAISDSGILYVVDSGNDRVQRFQVTEPPAPADTTPPSLVVSGKKKVITTRATLKIKGTAADAGGIARVEGRAGKSNYKPATGAADWIFTAKLKPGKNVILLRAVDAAGNFSATVKVTAIRQ